MDLKYVALTPNNAPKAFPFHKTTASPRVVLANYILFSKQTLGFIKGLNEKAEGRLWQIFAVSSVVKLASAHLFARAVYASAESSNPGLGSLPSGTSATR